MSHPYYETFRETNNTGISFSFVTAPGGYHPLHWHEELEILYPLNGEADITIEKKKYRLMKKHLMVIESSQVHSTFCYDKTSMFLCIHISRKELQKYMPDLELYQIHCISEQVSDEKFPFYLEICKLLEELTRLYVEDAPTFSMEAEGILLQVLAQLLKHFSSHEALTLSHVDQLTRERLRTVISYVAEHFREPISLGEVSGMLGLGNEYFCRFFKKNMGLSFLNYVNEVRVTHIYQDLVGTDSPVSEIMESNGFTNQKLFNRCFRETYGCTPSSVRKNNKNTI